MVVLRKSASSGEMMGAFFLSSLDFLTPMRLKPRLMPFWKLDRIPPVNETGWLRSLDSRLPLSGGPSTANSALLNDSRTLS